MWKLASSPTEPSATDNVQGEASSSSSSSRQKNPGRRFAQVIRLRKDCVDEYKACHGNIWPEVAQHIRSCGIRNYAIFYDDATGLLFASFLYVGYDYAGDMQRMAENAKVREWWKMTDGYQESLVPGAVSSEAGVPSWWKPMEEVYYQA